MKLVQELVNEIIKGVIIDKNKGDKELVELLTDWGKSIVDEILTDPSMIYVTGKRHDDDDDEAVYSYEAFEKFKREKII